MRRYALAVRDEVDPEPIKPQKTGVRLRYQLYLPSSLEFRDQPIVGNRDLDNSRVGSHSPQVLLLIGANVFRQDFGGEASSGTMAVILSASMVLPAGFYFPTMCGRSFSFSQMDSISSTSGRKRQPASATFQGLVYAFGSSIVA